MEELLKLFRQQCLAGEVIQHFNIIHVAAIPSHWRVIIWCLDKTLIDMIIHQNMYESSFIKYYF